MAKRQSKTRHTLAATALLVLLAVLIPWGCEFEPSAIGRPPVQSVEDDAGEDDQ